VEMVARDLQRSFAASKSFSPDNLWRMRQLYVAYSAPEFLGQAVPEIRRTVEYALRTKRNPIGVAAYQLQSKLPGNLRGKLPTAKQLSEAVRGALPERSGK